jgi:predicted ATPase
MATFHEPFQMSYEFLSWTQMSLGYLEQADESMNKAIELAEQQPIALIKVNGLFMAATLAAFNRRYDRAKEFLDRCMKYTEDHLLYFWLAPNAILLGFLESQTGDPQQAFAHASEGFALMLNTGKLSLPYQVGRYAEICLAADKIDEGLEAITHGLTAFAERGERYWESEVHRVHGELLMRAKRFDDAVTAFNTAIEVARQQDARLLELRALTSLLRNLPDDAPQRATVIEDLTNLCAWFTEGLDHPDLIDAKALLKESLRSSPH